MVKLKNLDRRCSWAGAGHTKLVQGPMRPKLSWPSTWTALIQVIFFFGKEGHRVGHSKGCLCQPIILTCLLACKQKHSFPHWCGSNTNDFWLLMDPLERDVPWDLWAGHFPVRALGMHPHTLHEPSTELSPHSMLVGLHSFFYIYSQRDSLARE